MKTMKLSAARLSHTIHHLILHTHTNAAKNEDVNEQAASTVNVFAKTFTHKRGKQQTTVSVPPMLNERLRLKACFALFSHYTYLALTSLDDLDTREGHAEGAIGFHAQSQLA
eukprot:scaffold219_cov85-Skeletonema_marinoi.AAC.2